MDGFDEDVISEFFGGLPPKRLDEEWRLSWTLRSEAGTTLSLEVDEVQGDVYVEAGCDSRVTCSLELENCIRVADHRTEGALLFEFATCIVKLQLSSEPPIVMSSLRR